ncbi:MAG: ABC transporter substrate-binding protein [Acidimicrobiales bacterium]
MTISNWGKRLTLCGVVVAASAVTIATSSVITATSSSASSTPSTVNISDEYGVTWNCQFNPYNASDQFDSFGVVYEELVYVNNLKDGAVTPWLATSWAWGNGNRTLTFTIRKGVTWTDGQPFSAQDVLFTFDLLKNNPSLDLNADWSVLRSVALRGSDQVVFNFKTPAVPYFYYIADQTPIVPAHLWSSIKGPATYLDPHPIGTGPYVMSSCSGANIQYTKNAHYWQPGLPKIQTVNFPSYLSNNTANQDLKSGVDQWGSQFIPNIQKYYLDANPKYYHYWFDPGFNVDMFINLTNPILSNLAVRQAMAYGINRAQVSQIGEYGYEPPSNQTMIVKPTFSGWYDPSLAAKYGNAYAYNPSKAISILEAAGFKRGSDGIFAKDGQKLSFTIINNSGFSDWVSAVNVVQANLKAVGIQVTPNNLSNTTFEADVFDGHYQLAYNWIYGSFGPTPYYELRDILYSANSAPIGKSAASNYERYMSKSTDALIDQYAATTSPAAQHAIVDELEGVMLSQVPVIPVTEAVDWYQYDTQNIGGWVTPSDPYAQPAQYAVPDWGVVLLHLYAK